MSIMLNVNKLFGQENSFVLLGLIKGFLKRVCPRVDTGGSYFPLFAFRHPCRVTAI